MKNENFFAYITLGLLFFAVVFASIAFVYGKGTSYLSDNPQACNNCHVMNEAYDSWKNGNHHHVAVCNDCHVPNNFIGKWITKGENGFHHSVAFTFGKVPVNIRARDISKEISVQNCIRCHDTKLHQSNHSLHQSNSENCISCHKNVGHFH